MKPLNFLIVALGLAAGAASAQPPLGPLPGGRFDLDNLAILLDLDAYQKGEVGRVLEEQRTAMVAEREAMRAARESESNSAATGQRPPGEEMRARRDANRDELFGKLQNILTEQQMTKLKILMAPPQGGRGPRGGGQL